MSLLPLEFSFNQEELEAMIGNPATSKVVISTCNVPEPDGVSELYLCAQAFGSDDKRITAMPVAAGCPNPPGWRLVKQSLINKTALKYAPSFAIDAAKLKIILKKNELVQEGMKKLLVELGGKKVTKLSRETGKKVTSFESLILFKITYKDPGKEGKGTKPVPRPRPGNLEANPF